MFVRSGIPEVTRHSSSTGNGQGTGGHTDERSVRRYAVKGSGARYGSESIDKNQVARPWYAERRQIEVIASSHGSNANSQQLIRCGDPHL